MRFEDELARLLKEAKKASRGYLSKRQEAYFKQRKKKPRRRRIGMLQKQLKPHEIRAMQQTGLSAEDLALASRAGGGDWREGIRRLLPRRKGKGPVAAPAGEKLTPEQKEAQTIAKEERAAKRNQQAEYRKRIQQLDDACRDADTEEKRALIKQQIDTLTGREPEADLTPEEREDIADAPSQLPEIDEELKNLKAMELEMNRNLSDEWREGKGQPVLSPEEKLGVWKSLTNVSESISKLVRDKQVIQSLIARTSELAAYEQEMRRRDRLEEEQRLVDLEKEAASVKAAGIIEEALLRPKETREAEAKRELAEKVAETEAVTKARLGEAEPFKVKAAKRKTEEAKRKEKLEEDRQASKDMRSRILAGEKGLDAKFLTAIHKEYNEPDVKQQAWLDDRDRIKRELIVYNQQLRYLLREEYAEDSSDVRNVKQKILNLTTQLKKLGKKPDKEESLETFVIRRKKEIDKELGVIKKAAKAEKQITGKVETIVGKSGRVYPGHLVDWARAHRDDEDADALLFDIGE